MGYIVVILGESGSGKDTAYGLLKRQLALAEVYCWSFKFTRNPGIKDWIEDAYGLPYGFLDDPESKSQTVPGHPEGITFSDLMLRFYQVMPQVDPTMFVRAKERKLKAVLSAGDIPVFTDIRNLPEVHMLTQNLSGHRLMLVSLYRDSATRKSSDGLLETIRDALDLRAAHHVHIVNNGPLEDLAKELKDNVADRIVKARLSSFPLLGE